MNRTTILQRALFASLIYLIANTGFAGCISISQPSVLDTSFRPMVLDFQVHLDTQWTGMNQGSAIDRTFNQRIKVNTLWQPDQDFCNNSVTTSAALESTDTPYTADVGQYVGADLSTRSSFITYTVRSTDFFSSNQYTTIDLSVGTSEYRPVLNPTTGTYFYADYDRGIFSREYLPYFYYTLGDDLFTYLTSLIGNYQFEYRDLATLVENYQRFDQYGYTGTAVLTGISQVPLPGSALFFASALSVLWGRFRVNRYGR